MDIGAIGKMLGMARGQQSLRQEGPQQGGKTDTELLRKLLEMLSSSGSAGSGGSAAQLDPEQIKKMMAGREGMQAIMPDSDNGRKVSV